MRAFLGWRTCRLVAIALLTLVALWSSRQLAAGTGDEATLWRTIPVAGNPEHVAVNPDTGRLYVTHVTNDLNVLDAASGQVLATLPQLGSAMALNRTTNRLYVASWFFGRVSVVDLATNTVTAEIAVPEKPTRIAVNPTMNRIYVNANEPKISVIDGNTNTVIDEIDQLAQDVAVDPKTNTLYAIGPYMDESTDVVIIDGATHQVIGEVQVGVAAAAIEVDPASGTVFVATSVDGSTAASKLWIADARTDTVKKAITVDGWVVELGVNTATHRVYAVQFAVESGSVVIFDKAGTRMATVPVGAGPTDIAVDEVHELVYTADANASQISVIGRGPAPSSSGSPTPMSARVPAGGGSPASNSPGARTLLAAGLVLTALGASLVLRLCRSHLAPDG